MSLSGITSNFEPDRNLKQIDGQEERLQQEPDGESIFAELIENGNKTVDIEDVVCAEGTTLSNKIMKFLTDNKGKKWTQNLTFTLNNLINEFNYEKFKEQAKNDFKTFEENALKEQEALIEKETQRLKAELAKKKLHGEATKQAPQFVLLSEEEEMPVKGVDKEQPVYQEDDFADAMAEPWTEYEYIRRKKCL